MDTTKEELLLIVKKAYEEHIYSILGHTIWGPESYIEGKDDFFKELDEEFDKL